MVLRLSIPRSLRGQLVLWLSLALSLVLVCFTLVVIHVLSLRLLADLDQSLADRAQQLAGTLRRDARLAEQQALEIPSPDTFELADAFVQVRALDGQVLGRSENLEEATLPLRPADLDHLLAEPDDGQYAVTRLGRERLRLYTRLLQIEEQPIAIIQVARSLDVVEQPIADLQVVAGVGLLMTLVVAGIIIWLTTSRALRPLEQVIATADTIDALQDLRHQVAVPATSAEVARLAATINHMLTRLAAAEANQRRFIADASHELRTPLTTIRGNAELLSQFPDVTAEDRTAALAQIEHEAARLSRLVDDLLTLARADAQQPLARQPVALAPLLAGVVAQLRQLAAGQRLDLVIMQPAMVIGDPDALRQLAMIVLDNALKYTPAGGRIAVRLERCDGQAQVVVTDTGCGIAAADLPHIFERFYRADHSRQAGGTGLGLAIAQWIVTQHGGHIAVTSGPGQGTTVTITLPHHLE